jgi:hypothetical protein
MSTDTPATGEAEATTPATGNVTNADGSYTTPDGTTFRKIERDVFQRVLSMGTPEFCADGVKNLTTEQLERGLRWAEGLRRQKAGKTFLIMPVSKAKQSQAGYLFFNALNAFTRAVRVEHGIRTANDAFATA